MAITDRKYDGKGLSLTIDSVEYNIDASQIVLDTEDADDLTFAELAAGGKQWFFTITSVIRSSMTDSLWGKAWDDHGVEDVAFLYKPFGNAVATAAQPHFSGTLTIPDPVGLGGESGSTWTYELRLDVDGVPTRLTGGGS